MIAPLELEQAVDEVRRCWNSFVGLDQRAEDDRLIIWHLLDDELQDCCPVWAMFYHALATKDDWLNVGRFYQIRLCTVDAMPDTVHRIRAALGLEPMPEDMTWRPKLWT